MIIKPHENYHMVGTDSNLRLDKTRNYVARPATNQPDWKEKGKVFVSFDDDSEEPSILLDKFDYDIIQP